MARFADVETEQPDFAARVRRAFDAHRHKFLATLRADGAPRISGIEAAFGAGDLWLAGMTRSVKFGDLRRDPRMALHSGSDEPDDFAADAKISGRAVEVTDPDGRAGFAEATGSPAGGDYELFRIDVGQVVLIALAEDRSALVVSSWKPGAGIAETRRT
jgi:Pyridoxamine 5'-phosphate oxidase